MYPPPVIDTLDRQISYYSDLYNQDSASLIGKTIAKINASEYELELVFTDGSTIKINGHTWED